MKFNFQWIKANLRIPVSKKFDIHWSIVWDFCKRFQDFFPDKNLMFLLAAPSAAKQQQKYIEENLQLIAWKTDRLGLK